MNWEESWSLVQIVPVYSPGMSRFGHRGNRDHNRSDARKNRIESGWMNFKYKIIVQIRLPYLNRCPRACAIAIMWLHRYFTGIHQLLPCQTVVRHARVGATSALLRDTMWPNRESLYLLLGHGPCRFTTLSPSGFTVERRIVAEELRWCPGSPQNKPALGSLPVSPSCIKILNTTGATPWWSPVQHGLSQFNAVLPGVVKVVVPVGPGIAPGLYTRTVWIRL
jgi:hypothetical protein